MIRAGVRRALDRLERSRAALPLANALLGLLRATPLRRGLVVMQHRVAAGRGDDTQEFTPAMSRADLSAQLALLARHCCTVPASDIQASAASRRRGEPFPVAITFDDDTVSHIDDALPVLAEHGVSATFFLNGIALGEPRQYWWELLQAGRDDGAGWEDLVPAGTLDEARELGGGSLTPWDVSGAVQQMAPPDRAALTAELTARYGETAPTGLGRQAIGALLDAGHAVGWHGHRHEPMALLAPEALARELDDGRVDLEAVVGAPLTLIAYPHGWGDPAAAQAVRERGFTAGFTTESRAVRAGDDALLLGRVDGWPASLGAFALRLVEALLRR
ncbi:MAG: polysaccharide deacetylase family protein [Solirubrobacteraceae bacterium]|nr:polysaccharide deacetylase family protein [Solirubrobacteraceae bacterium]